MQPPQYSDAPAPMDPGIVRGEVCSYIEFRNLDKADHMSEVRVTLFPHFLGDRKLVYLKTNHTNKLRVPITFPHTNSVVVVLDRLKI